jgi:putative Ca2+/H+ antiporter (TMEM165/GDT1 family)
MTVKKWFAVMTITAFIGVISFFHVNSYIADKNKINGLFIVAGVVFSLVAIYSFWQANKFGNPGKPK